MLIEVKDGTCYFNDIIFSSSKRLFRLKNSSTVICLSLLIYSIFVKEIVLFNIVMLS